MTRRMAKFALVGILNMAVDFAGLNLLIVATGFDKGLPLAILNLLSFGAAVINSYAWNRRWVFESQEPARSRELATFVAISGGAALLSSAIVGGITHYVPAPRRLAGLGWANAAKAVATLASFGWNFLGYRFLVFGGPPSRGRFGAGENGGESGPGPGAGRH